MGESLGLLFGTLARAAVRRVSEFKPRELANTAWAFATVNRPDDRAFMALARAAARRVSEFKPSRVYIVTSLTQEF